MSEYTKYNAFEHTITPDGVITSVINTTTPLAAVGKTTKLNDTSAHSTSSKLLTSNIPVKTKNAFINPSKLATSEKAQNNLTASTNHDTVYVADKTPEDKDYQSQYCETHSDGATITKLKEDFAMVEVPHKRYNIAKLKKRQHPELEQYKQVALKCPKSFEDECIKEVRMLLLEALTKLDKIQSPEKMLVIEQ